MPTPATETKNLQNNTSAYYATIAHSVSLNSTLSLIKKKMNKESKWLKKKSHSIEKKKRKERTNRKHTVRWEKYNFPKVTQEEIRNQNCQL